MDEAYDRRDDIIVLVEEHAAEPRVRVRPSSPHDVRSKQAGKFFVTLRVSTCYVGRTIEPDTKRLRKGKSMRLTRF